MKIFILFLLLLSYSYCNAYDVIIYGVDNCGYTTDLRNACTQNNISFKYYNVNDTKYFNEMAAVVYEFNLAVDNYVNLPVVKVTVDGRSYGFSRPSINKIKELITSSGVKEIKLVVIGSNVIYVGGMVRSIEIFNSIGSKILYTDNNQVYIDFLPQGLYIVRVNANNRITISKLLITKGTN